ncbi:CBS domain-containing protein [archaeon]|nr:CBS domain-containing protein [archaeon]
MSEEVLLVNDIMAKDVITVNANRPVSEVIKILVEKDISGVVVADYVGDVVGMISAIDVFKVFNEEKNDKEFIAEDIMTPYAINIQPEMPAEDAARTMLENGVHRLVVTMSPSKRKPIGIISSTDILRAFG